MVEDISISVALLIGGWCLFLRRNTWKCGLKRALTVSVVLICVGIVLTSPLLTIVDNQLLITSVGVQHFDDYLGHVCFLAALCTISYAVLARTVADRQVRKLMRWRVEYPTAIAAVIMLVLITISPRLRRETPVRNDFFEVTCGGYLHAYWAVYTATLLYLLGYIFALLRHLRHDPRSRQTANLYLMTCVLGIIGASAEFLDTWFHFLDDGLWLLLTAPAVMASIAAAVSWLREHRQMVNDPEIYEEGPTPPGTPMIPT